MAEAVGRSHNPTAAVKGIRPPTVQGQEGHQSRGACRLRPRGRSDRLSPLRGNDARRRAIRDARGQVSDNHRTDRHHPGGWLSKHDEPQAAAGSCGAGHAERRKVSARWRALGVLLLIHFVVLPIATKVFARGIVEKAQASIVRHVENISIDDSRENKQFRSTRRYGGNRLFIPIAPGGYAGEFVDGIRCDSFVPWRKIRPPIKQLFNVGIKIVGTCWHCLQTDDMPFKDCRSLSGVSDTDVDSDLLSWNERIDTPSFNRKPRSLIQSHLIGSLLNGSLRSLGASSLQRRRRHG